MTQNINERILDEVLKVKDDVRATKSSVEVIQDRQEQLMKQVGRHEVVIYGNGGEGMKERLRLLESQEMERREEEKRARSRVRGFHITVAIAAITIILNTIAHYFGWL